MSKKKSRADKKRAKKENTKMESAATEKPKLSNKEYEAEIFKLHAELVKLQRWVKEKGIRAVVVFEGPRDGATLEEAFERGTPLPVLPEMRTWATSALGRRSSTGTPSSSSPSSALHRGTSQSLEQRR